MKLKRQQRIHLYPGNIISGGHRRDAISSVAIETNPETRKSRLFKSNTNYVSRSSMTIVRAFMMYKPLRIFS